MREVAHILSIFAILAGAAAAQTAGSAPRATPPKAVVDQYCSGCHNDKVRSGEMTLTKLDLAHPEQSAELAEKVIRKVRAGMMPPAGLPRPTPAAALGFVQSIEAGLDQAALAHPNPGRPALHRLNRVEYANSIRDLLGVQVDVSALLPTDDMSHGFDNMADVLTMSPALMEGYIRAAGKISREAVGDPAALALTSTYSIPRVLVANAPCRRHAVRHARRNLGYARLSGRWRVRASRWVSTIRPRGPLFGMNQGKGQQIEIAVNGERVALLDINPNMKLANDGIKTPPIKLRAGPQRISASFPQKFDGPIEDDTAWWSRPGGCQRRHGARHDDAAASARAEHHGPAEGRRRFRLRPAAARSSPAVRLRIDEIPCAKKIITTLARQAYRRPVTDNDIEDLLSFYQAGRNRGISTPAFATAIQAILANPEFVFRFERTPASVAPGSNYRISDLELASRLSFFLWSSASGRASCSAWPARVS